MPVPPNKLKKFTHQQVTDVTMSKDVMREPKNGSFNTTSATNVGRVPRPLTPIEQYWATRALKAEALLAAEDEHRKEYKTMEHMQDMKREVLSPDALSTIWADEGSVK